MNSEQSKSITLYDAGGAFLTFLFLGLPLGTLFDYVWNLLIMNLTLHQLPDSKDLFISKWRKFFFSVFITILGFVIDWAYFEITWNMTLGKSAEWFPAMDQWLQFVWLLLPILMLFLVNATLSYSFFHLERKQALLFGTSMALFTAPWLLPIVPYVAGWVV